jgi:7-keto-8-aminopelargonate synthetase-like enzyme
MRDPANDRRAGREQEELRLEDAVSFVDREPIYGKEVHGGAAARWRIGADEYLNFSGAAYLALHDEPVLRRAAYEALERGYAFQHQLGPLYGFIDPPLDRLQAAAAEFMGCETALYFSSGFFIGQIGLCAHSAPGDHLYLDGSAHYNLVQAAKLSGLPSTTFAHRDPGSLEEAVSKTLGGGERPLVVTDGMFATTGDLAPLDQYRRVIEPFGGRMFVDDAHGFGVLGANGRGCAEHFGVEDIADIGGTLSKAFCSQGAVIGCTRETAQRVIHVPPARGANAGSPISAAVAAAAIGFVRAHPERRAHLWEVSAHVRSRLRAIGIDVSESPSPVMAFKMGDRANMRRIQHRLFERQIYLPISDYIGAGPGGVFRCAIFADHSLEDIDRFAEELAGAV